MTILRILLTESWPDNGGDEALEWVLLGGVGVLSKRGRSKISEMPCAEQCELIAPASAVLLTSVKLPFGKGEKARRLLPFAVEDKLAVDLETVHIAMGEAVGEGHIAVAVVDKHWLQNTQKLLAGAGLKPHRMVPETLLVEQQGSAWEMAWDGLQGFVRTGKITGQSLNGDARTIPFGLDMLLKEAHAKGKMPDQLIVHPMSDGNSLNVDDWAGQLGLPVVLGARWDWRAVSLAAVPIDLLQGEFARRHFTVNFFPRLKPALALLGVIVVVQLIAMTADWWLLKREQNHLRATMEASFRQAFPEATVVVDPVLQMERQLAVLRRAAGQSSPGDFLPLLGKVSPLLDMAGGTKLRKVHYENNGLKLELTLPTQAAVDAMRARFAGAAVKAELAADAATAEGVPLRITLSDQWWL